MINRRSFTSAAALFALTACAKSSFPVYTGPPVTSILVQKERRKMYLMNDNTVLQEYDFELGFAPRGHKEIEGDGKTPEGTYFIDRKNPNSSFHLSLGLSYPNAEDRANAAALGQSPGGDIFIHGTPKLFQRDTDWTWGCIAVTNNEIEDIYNMVNIGTPIFLFA